MNRYFRLQRNGELDMHSQHLNEDTGEYDILPGIAASSFASGLDGSARFGGAWDAYDDDNGAVFILEGDVIEKLYDGVVLDTKTVKIIAKFTKADWSQMLDSGKAYDWEYI